MEITTEMIKELRDATGCGILDCRAALRDADGNFICNRMIVSKSHVRGCKLKWQQTHLHLQSGASVRVIFHVQDKKTAEQNLQMTIQKYARSAPRLSTGMEDNLAEGFTVFDFSL